MMKWLLLAFSCFLLASPSEGARLGVSGRDLTYGGQKVFLSGVNIAWNSYGYDFGNNQYASSKSTLEGWLTSIANAGGNSVRIWLHVEGDNTPQYNGNGFVVGTDQGNTLINDMKAYMDFAQSKNILVIWVLWNGAYLRNQNTINLMWDDAKLQSYIDNALIPMVRALGNHPALGAWEIMNEPEGSVYNGQSNSNPCFDTTPLTNTGAGWVGHFIPMQNILKFVNWQAAAIKATNPGSLVTVGSWTEHAQNDVFSESRNYYTDACLRAAGGRSGGTLDFYQMHTYANGGNYQSNAPFNKRGTDYGLDKPLVIGEFAAICSGSIGDVTRLYNHAYDSNYQGAWAWQYNAGGECSDDRPTQDRGMTTLRGKTNNGVVNFPVGF